jgi:erythritol transport system ATP-binding protein
MTVSDVVLRVENATKVYSGVTALKGVDFDVVAGEVNVLVGENGAGKSTLMKLIAGVERPTSGRILVDGKALRFAGPADAAHAGVAIVFQELNLFDNLSVAENMFIRREITRAGLDIDHPAQIRRAEEVLAHLSCGLSPQTMVGDLTLGQKQIVEIARALVQDVKVLILDEPTSALSSVEAESLFRVIAELKQRNVGIVYISHRLQELMRIGDRVTVLRDGVVTGNERMADIDLAWIIGHMTALRKAIPHVRSRRIGPVVLQVENIRLPSAQGGMSVDDVSLEVREGEILGIYGVLGAGRTWLLNSVMGCYPASTGSVLINGKRVASKSVPGRIRAGMALVPEDRKTEGIVRTMSVAQNLTLAALGRLALLFHLDKGVEARAVQEKLIELGVKTSGPNASIEALSGGNQQKVVLGKALLTRPKVLLMDEPTRGVDVGAKGELYEVTRRLADDGLAVLFATSEVEEALELADRIAVMREGRIVAMFARADATQEAIIAAADPVRKAA